MLAITDFMLPLIHRKMCNVPVNRNYGARSKQRLLFHHMATMMPREREGERWRERVRRFVRNCIEEIVANGNSKVYRSEVGSERNGSRWCSWVFFFFLFLSRIEYYLFELLELHLTESVVASVNEYHGEKEKERERLILNRSTDTRNLQNYSHSCFVNG